MLTIVRISNLLLNAEGKQGFGQMGNPRDGTKVHEVSYFSGLSEVL